MAVQVIVVFPTGYADDNANASERTPEKVKLFEQLSVAVGLTIEIAAPQTPGSAVLAIATGQDITGFSLSTTVTVKLHITEPQSFVAVITTEVMP